jgi:hypothetical protein
MKMLHHIIIVGEKMGNSEWWPVNTTIATAVCILYSVNIAKVYSVFKLEGQI